MRRNYPSWELVHLGERDLGCARFDAYVKKSGKSGVGVVVALKPRRPGCEATVTAAQLELPEEKVPASAASELGTSPKDGCLYLAFPFDNESAWNDRQNQAQLRLTLRIEGREESLILPMRQRWNATHVSDREGLHEESREPAARAPDDATPLPSSPLAPRPDGDEDFAEPPQ
ncbi:MAG: hypothetical protein R3B13_05790 [Polyangiaceae bacterium]